MITAQFSVLMIYCCIINNEFSDLIQLFLLTIMGLTGAGKAAVPHISASWWWFTAGRSAEAQFTFMGVFPHNHLDSLHNMMTEFQESVF